MTLERLEYALRAGGLTLPETGTVVFVGLSAEVADLPIPADRAEIVQSFAPDHAAWLARGLRVRTAPEGPYAAAVVSLPRARELAEARIAEAEAMAAGGLVVLDGAKTDGIEAIAKALRAKGVAPEMVSKAHGKCLWFRAGAHLGDWARPAMQRNAQGDMVCAGVFSADGADPASVALAAALPETLSGEVADLGAGWGWLSREVLRRPKVASLHLVEADLRALDCARVNAADARARFHWADATGWMSPALLDAVVMNPPFHVGRKAEPALGQAFVRAAARNLRPSGTLWMVANRHLPYETVLADCFREVRELSGTGGFKILQATRPSRAAR
jgi:16S rRNA (guanine1207-N2)-methyltransferase